MASMMALAFANACDPMGTTWDQWVLEQRLTEEQAGVLRYIKTTSSKQTFKMSVEVVQSPIVSLYNGVTKTELLKFVGNTINDQEWEFVMRAMTGMDSATTAFQQGSSYFSLPLSKDPMGFKLKLANKTIPLPREGSIIIVEVSPRVYLMNGDYPKTGWTLTVKSHVLKPTEAIPIRPDGASTKKKVKRDPIFTSVEE